MIPAQMKRSRRSNSTQKNPKRKTILVLVMKKTSKLKNANKILVLLYSVEFTKSLKVQKKNH